MELDFVTQLVLLVLIAILLGFFKVFFFPIIKYYFRKHKYAHLPQYNSENIMMPVISLFLQPNLLLVIADSTKDTKGKMQEVVHFGPGFDGNHNVVVTHPEGIKEILLDEETFSKQLSSVQFTSKLLGKGLATSSAHFWKSQRKSLEPVFQVKNLISGISEESFKFLEKIRETKGEFIEAKALLNELSISCIIRLVFGDIDSKWMKDQWSQVLSEMNYYFLTWQAFGKIADFSPFGLLFKSSRSILRTKVKDWIEERRKQNSTEKIDLLSNLLQVIDEESGKSIPDDLVVDQTLTFLLNGQDSLSAILSWASYFISCSPEIQEKVDSVLQGKLPSSENIRKMNYLQSVIQETLRIRPPFAMIDRVAVSDTQIMGHKIPKGTNIYAFIQALHLNPQEWKEPENFDPLRFSGNQSKFNWNYLPFSGGPRVCIAEKIALEATTIILATLIQSFEIIRDETKQVYPKVGITTEIEGFYAKFVARK